MKLKKVLALLMAASMAASVTACNSSKPAEEDKPATPDTPAESVAEGETSGDLGGELDIWAWGADAEAKSREAGLEAFIAKHPEIKVTYTVIPTADQVWDQKAAAALASGSAGDVMQMSPDYFGMNTKYYKDLNPLVERDGVNLDEVLVPGMIDGYYDTDGKLEGFPLLANCFVMAYNKDMFDAAGVAYPEDGWKMEDLLDWGTKFATGSGADQTYAMVKHWVMNNVMVYAGGGLPYEADLSASKMDSPEVLKGLSLYGDLINKGLIPTEVAQKSMPAGTLFVSGKAALYPMGGFEAITIVNDAAENGVNLGYCMMPSGSDGKEINVQYATGWAITETCENVDAAWEFLKDSAFQSDEMCKETCTAGMTSSKAIAESYYKDMKVGDFAYGDYVPHMANTHLNPFGGTLASAGNIWTKMIDAVTLDGQDPAEVQKTYAPQIATEFAGYEFNKK